MFRSSYKYILTLVLSACLLVPAWGESVKELQKKQIELILDYPPRKIDVPVKMNRQRLTKYTEIDVSKFL